MDHSARRPGGPAARRPGDAGDDTVEARAEGHVVEDHPLFRLALVRGIAAEADLRVGMAAGSVEEFAADRRSVASDDDDSAGTSVVTLDLKLPGISDAEAVAAVAGMGFRVLVLSAYARRADLFAAMSAGARGFVGKDAGIHEICGALRAVAAGGNYVAPTLAGHLIGSSPPNCRRRRLRCPIGSVRCAGGRPMAAAAPAPPGRPPRHPVAPPAGLAGRPAPALAPLTAHTTVPFGPRISYPGGAGGNVWLSHRPGA